MAKTKVRNAFVLLHGQDTPDAVVDQISGLVGQACGAIGLEVLVSNADREDYDHFERECDPLDEPTVPPWTRAQVEVAAAFVAGEIHTMVALSSRDIADMLRKYATLCPPVTGGQG